MSYIDIIIVIFLLWGAYKGFSSGLVKSLATFVALLLGIYGAIKFSNYSADFLKQHFSITNQYLQIIAFAVTFIIIIVAVHLIARLIDKLLQAVALGLINKLLGALFGILKYMLLVGVILIITNSIDRKTNFMSDKTKGNSLLYQPMTNLSLKIYPSLENFIVKCKENNPLV